MTWEKRPERRCERCGKDLETGSFWAWCVDGDWKFWCMGCEKEPES